MPVDAKKYFESLSGLNALAARVGTREITLKGGRRVTVRAVSAAAETTVNAAIPRPEVPTIAGTDKPDYQNQEYQAMLAMRADVVRAGLAAYALVGYSTEGGATWDNPGGDRTDARPVWIRAAAKEILSAFHADDLAAIVNGADALSTDSPAEDAGKGSGRGTPSASKSSTASA